MQFEQKTTSLPTSIQFALGDCFLTSHNGVAITPGLVMGGTMLRHFRNDRATTQNVSSRCTASCGLPGGALLGLHSRGRNLFIAAFFPASISKHLLLSFVWSLGSVAHHEASLNILIKRQPCLCLHFGSASGSPSVLFCLFPTCFPFWAWHGFSVSLSQPSLLFSPSLRFKKRHSSGFLSLETL